MFDFKPLVYLLYFTGALLLAQIGWDIYWAVS